MKLSVVIPAYNESGNILESINKLRTTLDGQGDIPYEIICVNDNSTDNTAEIIENEMIGDARIRLVSRTPPGGFGRAVRSGLDAARGDVVIVFMADLSDDPDDAVFYYRKIQEGYDCVFGSRFMRGAKAEHYPRIKLVVNRIVNRIIQVLFWAEFNDLTNAFKAYRTEVIRECGPFRASHFNITLEMSLSALIRDYDIAQIPIRWHGRKWGRSSLRMREMGRKYLCTLLMIFCQRLLIRDDVIAEKVAARSRRDQQHDQLERRIEVLENKLETSVTADSQTASSRRTNLPR